MKANHSPMSVADYCQACIAKTIIVNEDYQRKEGLWNNAARSFFIESIVLEYPIPKIFLYAKIDLKTKQTVKEIVDGQQRTQALVSFFDNKLTLSKTIETEELRGLNYARLPDALQSVFLSYSLPIDQFSGVTDDEVREAFRRMNANNVPLNAEEQRNARFQGAFKWFIVSIAEHYKDVLFRLGVFSRRDMIRMVDLRLYAELVYTLDAGFQTVKGVQLDRLYKKYNASFNARDKFHTHITYGIDYFVERSILHRDVFLRMHITQSIILAAIDLQFGGLFPAEESGISELTQRIDEGGADIELLANSLRDPAAYPQLSQFVGACMHGTNTGAARLVRFLYFRGVLAGV